MLKGRTSATFLIATCFVLDISLFSQLISFHPPAGMVRSRAIVAAPGTAPVTGASPALVQSVTVEGILNLPVVQQPKGNPNYVSPNEGELTQFGAISQYGNIGLLAHNYLEGRAFSRLKPGHEVHILYSDGTSEHFVVAEILRYQALDPKSPYSSFQNIDDQEEILSVGQMVDRVYKGAHHLTFQTCISRYGNSSWGRLFIMAMPKPEYAEGEALSLQNNSDAWSWSPEFP